jgi:hypothetical protein
VPTSAASFLDESPASSAASFLDEGPSAAGFLDAVPVARNPIPQLRAAEEPGLLTRARESLSPLIGYTENQKLRQAQGAAQLQGALPQIAQQVEANRTDLLQKEGALPGIFTPSETQPVQLPQVGQQEGTLAQIGAGIYNPIAGAVNSAIASPGGMLTLPLSGPLAAVPALGRAVGGLFAADMARQTIENAPRALQTISDPNASTQQKVEAGTGLATTAALGGLGAVHALDARLAGKTPEQQSKAIREEIKVTEDKKVADALTDAADRIDREVAARDAAEAQAKEQQRLVEQQQKAVADAQKAQADQQAAAQEIPKSTQILQESAKPPVLANVATEAGTQTSPFALQGKLNEITAAPAPAVDPALAQISSEPAAPGAIEPTPRQLAARMRQERAGVKAPSFKAPMAETTAAPFEAPKVEPTAQEVKAADVSKAVKDPDTQYQFTVQQGGEGYPGYVQVDAILSSTPETQSRNTVSSSVKDLNAAGAKLPEVPDWVPTGQYTRAEIESLIKKGPPNEPTTRTTTGPVDRSADLGNSANASAETTAGASTPEIVQEYPAHYKAPRPLSEASGSLKDVLDYRKERIENYHRVLKEEIGLTDAQATRLKELLDRESSTRGFERELSAEKRAKLEEFFEGPLNQKNGPLEDWITESQFDPTQVAESNSKPHLAEAISDSLANTRELPAMEPSDRYIYPLAAIHRLKEIGGTWKDVSDAIKKKLNNMRAGQDGAELFREYGSKIKAWADQHGIDLPLEPASELKAAQERPAITGGAEPVANQKIDALSESKLTALADQLGIKTMGMSGERLRSRIISNALPEDIVGAIDNPVATPKRGKIKGSAADKWADSVIKQGRQLSGFDPELLAAHTIKLVGQLETGAVKFADWSTEKIKEAGEAIRPYLQQIWDTAHAQVAEKPGARVMEGDNRGTSRSALGKYDYIKTNNADQIAAAKPILDYVKDTGDYEGGFAKLRQIENSADRAVAAASMIESAEGIADPMTRDRVVARLFREAKGVGTDVAQGLQAQGTVNDIIAPYRGHLAWMDLIQSRLQDEVAPKFPADSAARINKGIKDAGDVAAEQIATDAPGVSSVLKGAISRIKKSVDIDWRKVFTDLPENQEARKAEIFKRINEDPKVASLPEEARQKLATTMEEAWENLRNKEFRKEFEKVIQLPSVGKVEREALTKALPDLVDKANLGLLDNEAFLEAMGRQYGIEGINSATGKKLRELGQKAARTPEGSERNEVFQQIMDTIMEARGVNPWDFLKDYWYRNVMSAPRTAMEIGAGGIIQGAARTFTTAVDTAVRQNQPGLALRMIGMFLKDAGTGARLGADLVATGDRAILPRYTETFLAKMKALESGKSPGGEIESLYRRSGRTGKTLLAPFEYTGRLLTALDYIGGQGVRSQQMLYSALTRGDRVSFDAAMRRFNAEEVAKARDQARIELGPKARPAQIIARQRELLNEGIDKQIQDFGNTMTEVTALNAPPVGIGGGIYKALSKLPMVVRAPAGLAFLKAGLNVAQELSNWGPVTGQINVARSLWRNPGKNNPFRFLALDKLPPERARQLVIAQATGLAVLVAAANKFLSKQPGDDQGKPRDWEISGPWTGLTATQKSALMSAGERPLSVKLPDGRWVDYKLSPFMSALATIGHWRDQERFNGKKWDDETLVNKAGNAWLMGLASIKDLSLASNATKLAGYLASDDRDVNMGSFERIISDSVGSAAVGLIPMSSMLRELDNTTDPQRYRPDKKNPGIDQWLSQVPFVRRYVGESETGQSQPMLNFLGRPVEVNVNPFNRHVGPGPSTEPVEAALSEKVSGGMKLPTLSDNTTIVDKDGKQRPMTGDETYAYQKAVRQAYARQIAADLPAFQKATPEQASLYSQQVFTAAERYARDRLNTGANWNGIIPADPKLSSALSPEYQAVKAADSAEGSQSALNASRLRIQYDNLMALPPEQRSAELRRVATTQPPEQTRALLQHATSRATERTALERATSGLTAPARAEYYSKELAKRATPEEKRAFLQQQFAAGLINKEVLRQLALQAQKN